MSPFVFFAFPPSFLFSLPTRTHLPLPPPHPPPRRHLLALIAPRPDPTLSLLKAICQVCPSIFPGLIVLCVLSSTSPCLLLPPRKSHLFPDLLYLSRLLLFVYLALSLLKPKGRRGLTLIDASDRGEERRDGSGLTRLILFFQAPCHLAAIKHMTSLPRGKRHRLKSERESESD